jgi:hypothetical protein
MMASKQARAGIEGGMRARAQGGPKEKRKVGRPIAYCGDPDSPDLTPSERRRIKRRIANRESARRVRARRQEQIEEMAVKVARSAVRPALLPIYSAALLLCPLRRHAASARLHGSGAKRVLLRLVSVPVACTLPQHPPVSPGRRPCD